MKTKGLFWRASGVVLTAAIAALLATCAGSPPPMAEAPPPMGPVTMKAAMNDKMGTFLVDDKGMSLYMYTKDTPNTSNCYGGCATNWPPLLVTADVHVPKELMTSLVGTTMRTDGTKQVTYAGWPLYYWVKDKAPGDVLGQGVGTVWYLVAPDGSLIKTAQ